MGEPECNRIRFVVYYFCFFRTEKHFTVPTLFNFPFGRLASSFQLLPTVSSFQLLPAASSCFQLPLAHQQTFFFGTPAIMLLCIGPSSKNLPEEFSFSFLHAVMLLCIGPSSSKNLHRGGGASSIHSSLTNSFIVRRGTERNREELQNRDGKMFLLRVLAYSCAQSNLYCLLYL